eukprot:3651461-Rhodomonas_salina.1
MGEQGTKESAKSAPQAAKAASKHSAKRQKIELQVVSVKNAPKTDTFGRFLVLKYGGKEAKTSTKTKDVENPIYKERFMLNLITTAEGSDLEVRCMDLVTGQAQVLGKCRVLGSELQQLALQGDGAQKRVELLLKDSEEELEEHDLDKTKVDLVMKIHGDPPGEAAVEKKAEEGTAGAKAEEAAKEPQGMGSQPEEKTRDVDVGPAGAGPGDAAKEAVKPAQSGREQVEVLVLGAKHLPKTDTFGACDPYLVLKYAGKEAKTSVKKGTLEPTWGERFLLNVIPNRELEVRCMDWDMFHKDDYVG